MKKLILGMFLLISASAWANNFCVGQSVVYTQSGIHYDATIVELYADGTASISFPNNEFSVSQISTSALSDHLQSENGFNVGDAVVYTQSDIHYNATIVELYADGSAEISFPNHEFSISQISLSTLSAHLSSENGFSVGEAVVYSQSDVHYNAKIDELFADGTALVEFPAGEFSASQVAISTLSTSRSREHGFTVGEAVVYDQSDIHYNAKIDELFADGTALVEFPGGEFSASQVAISTLSPPLFQENGFTVGEAVVYTQSDVHYNAKIDALYTDGTVLLEFPGGEFSRSQVAISTLSLALTCTQTCNR